MAITKATQNVFEPVLVTGSTTSRLLQDRFADVINVRDFGAVGDGVIDDTAAFSAAAFAAPAANNINGSRGTGIPRALICNIYVPAGTYKLSSMVNTYGKEVVWELNQAAILSNPDNLNGEVWRIAQRQSDNHHGSTDFACGMAFRNNVTSDSEAEVLGITSPSDLAVYTDRDTVGIYVDNASPPATLDSSSGTYTSKTVTTATIPSSDTVKKFRKGMIIDTKHSPAKWSGIVESWNANGTEFTVTDWYLVGGGGTPSTPTNGTGFIVNAFTKVWAHNANVFLTAAGHANQACGFELGVFNYKGSSPSPGANPKVWGYDCVNLTPNRCESAFISRGDFWHGFESIGQQVSFKSEMTSGSQTAFSSKGSGTIINSVNSSNHSIFSVGPDSNTVTFQIGNKQISNSPYFDFHSSGNGGTIDFDSRILASGGSSTTGTGNLIFITGEFVTNSGTVRSLNDITTPLGAASKRWTEIFAQNGTINTSDKNEKQQIRNISDVEKTVAIKLKSLFKAYKWNDAVEKKGENARIHFGVIAQDIKETFESEGLDANKYGMLCYDEWDSTEEIKDENQEVIIPKNDSGSRYGVRYNELFSFILANT
jgi:hypothetical protein